MSSIGLSIVLVPKYFNLKFYHKLCLTDPGAIRGVRRGPQNWGNV